MVSSNKLIYFIVSIRFLFLIHLLGSLIIDQLFLDQ